MIRLIQKFVLVSLAIIGFLASSAMAANEAISEMLESYRAEGAGPFDAERGKALWQRKFSAPVDTQDGPKMRSCTTCHGANLTQPGQHVRSGKIIKPMAPSANFERFSEAKKIRKWFRRNCKWVLGRECTTQEKGDLLSYLKDL